MKLRSFFANWKRGPVKIAGIYLLLGALWILFSDIVAAMIAPDQAVLTKISIYKGWGYIVVTAGLLYWLIRQYAKRIQKNEERFRSLYENATIGIYRTTPDGHILLCNPTLLHMLGYESFEQLSQRNLEAEGYEPGYERSEFRQKIESQGEVRGFESAWRKLDGSTVYVRESAKAIRDTEGNVLYYEGTVEDITERKRAEEEIENLARFPLENPNPVMRVTNHGQLIYANPSSRCLQDLWGCEIGDTLPADWKSLVAESAASQSGMVVDVQCTGQVFSIAVAPVPGSGYVNLYASDITGRKHAEEELRRSNSELEQFAYVASHDLQEPLRAVAGMAQLLQQRYQGKLDERANEYIDHAVEAASRMQKLINDLLTYSRVDRRGNEFELTELENVLEAALANLQVAIQESGAVVTHDPLPKLLADETQITQVFQNLIGNAIKFRGERPLKIHVGAQEVENAWRFEVRDNGIGIEPQYFERIFSVFQRLHTRREYPGTGIGLSLCKKILERHGGSLWVESEAGQGSSFYFTIPDRR